MVENISHPGGRGEAVESSEPPDGRRVWRHHQNICNTAPFEFLQHLLLPYFKNDKCTVNNQITV